MTQATHNERGRLAEDLAAKFLLRQGLKIVARNVRNRYGEIDIIAREEDTLVFVEVRLRKASSYGSAADSITAAKQKRLLAAASLYLTDFAKQPACRFDAILLDALEIERIVWQRDILQM